MYMKIEELKSHANVLRKGIVDVCYQSKAGHVGGSLSAIDILNTLYNHEMNINPKDTQMENRDRFILSKGHIAEALFVTLAHRGFFPIEELSQFSTYRSKYIGHPNNKVNGVEMNTGALGHGLSLGVGCAIAAKKLHKDYRTYVLMGDGEQAEGSLWEAAMAAAHYQLDNLVAIIDRNQLQISGTTESVMSLENLKGKWEMFGFAVLEINGNAYEDILQAFAKARTIKGKPTLLLANTIKGKGVSFMENEIAWHHGIIQDDQYLQACQELGGNIK